MGKFLSGLRTKTKCAPHKQPVAFRFQNNVNIVTNLIFLFVSLQGGSEQ